MLLQSLTGSWKLRAEFLNVTASHYAEVMLRPEGMFRFGAKHYPSPQGWMDARVPCDVLTPLMEGGFVQEPTEKTNSRNCTWTQNFSWWFRKTFQVTDDLLACEQIRLFIETLDLDAVLFLNGAIVGEHHNAFVPYEQDVRSYLRPGENVLVIRLTNGSDRPLPQLDEISYYNASGDEPRRCYLRKPQFSYGWDWCPCVPTCGIGGRVELRGISGALVRDVRLDTLALDDHRAQLKVYTTLEDVVMTRSGMAVLSWRLTRNGESAAQGQREVQLTGGLNYFTQHLTVEKPALWHVNGTGEPNLYELEVSVSYRGHQDTQSVPVGIRTVAIDTSPLPDGTRNFRLIINGRPIYCMGGNWVPPDVIYLRTPDEVYEKLVDEAAEAHFTMLRVWGGGRYETDAFYNQCSRRGILVMQDFMYACAMYPDMDPLFLHEAAVEADWQTRRLGHHACMAVWTGNNEIAESYWGWYDELAKGRYPYGTRIFNYILPQAVHANCPEIPYMPSSPFFGEYAKDPAQGDIHLWGMIGTLKRSYGMEDYHSFLPHVTHEIYDQVADQIRFNSEYGFYGSAMLSTIRRYHGDAAYPDAEILAHHKEVHGRDGMRGACVENLLSPVAPLSDEEFYVYSAIAQGIEYNQLSRSLRSQSHLSGNLIWMFNDAWPESGFTPIDYYLTRKPSYYFLKRAFAPRKLLLTVRESRARLVILNHTGEAVHLDYTYGFMTYTGQTVWQKTADIDLEPYAFSEAQAFDAPLPEAEGLYFAAPGTASVGFAHDTSSRQYWRDTPIPQGSVAWQCENTAEGCVITVTAGDAYVPIVEIRCEDDRTPMDDNYFDLLPRMTREIRVKGTVASVRALPLRACPRDFDPRDPYDFLRKRLQQKG